MNPAIWQTLGVVAVALVTGLFAPTVKTWLMGAQESDKSWRDQEAAAMATFRAEQTRAHENLRAEHVTLQDAYRDLERRYDAIETRCAGLELRLDAQNGELGRVRKENEGLHRENRELRAEVAALKDRIRELERAS